MHYCCSAFDAVGIIAVDQIASDPKFKLVVVIRLVLGYGEYRSLL